MAMTSLVAIPRRGVARWRGAMALMGLGPATTTAGLGWDFHVHEVAKEAAESIFAAPRLAIFAGFAILALGFLWALTGARIVPAASPA